MDWSTPSGQEHDDVIHPFQGTKRNQITEVAKSKNSPYSTQPQPLPSSHGAMDFGNHHGPAYKSQEF